MSIHRSIAGRQRASIRRPVPKPKPAAPKPAAPKPAAPKSSSPSPSQSSSAPTSSSSRSSSSSTSSRSHSSSSPSRSSSSRSAPPPSSQRARPAPQERSAADQRRAMRLLGIIQNTSNGLQETARKSREEAAHGEREASLSRQKPALVPRRTTITTIDTSTQQSPYSEQLDNTNGFLSQYNYAPEGAKGTQLAESIAAHAVTGRVDTGRDNALNCVQAVSAAQEHLSQQGIDTEVVVAEDHAVLRLPNGSYYDPSRAMPQANGGPSGASLLTSSEAQAFDGVNGVTVSERAEIAHAAKEAARRVPPSPMNRLLRIDMAKGAALAKAGELEETSAITHANQVDGGMATGDVGEVAAATTRLNALLDELPPDDKRTVMQIPSGLAGPDAASQITSIWRGNMEDMIPPGDPAALARYMDANGDTLNAVASMALNDKGISFQDIGLNGASSDEYFDQFYQPAIEMLAKDNPNAVFRLAAIDKDGGAVQQRLSPSNGTYDRQVVIVMTTPEGESKHFSVDPLQATRPDFGHNLDMLRDNVDELPPEVDTMLAELQQLHPTLGGPDDAIGRYEHVVRTGKMAGGAFSDQILEMSPESQQVYFQIASGNYQYPDAEPLAEPKPYGMFIREVNHLAADDVIAMVDVDHLAHDQRPAQLNSQIYVSGIPELGKMSAFERENFEALTDVRFAQFNARGDATRPLRGMDLINEIGTAMGYTPDNPDLANPELAEAALADKMFYSEGTLSAMEPILDQIQDIAAANGGLPANVTTLPISIEGEHTGLVNLPLFRVEGQNGKEFFVDDQGRSYDSFDDWKENNTLPPARMRYPEGGHLGGKVEMSNTPLVVDTTREKIEVVLDKAAFYGGIALGAAAVASSGGLATPLVAAGFAVAGWETYRSAERLHDMATHGQSINPLDSSQARGEYISIASNLLTMGQSGGVLTARGLARAGASTQAVNRALRFASYADLGSQVVDAVNTGNQGYTLATEWDNLDGVTKATMIGEMAFWAGPQVLSAVQAGGVKEYFQSLANSPAEFQQQEGDFIVNQQIKRQFAAQWEGGYELLGDMADHVVATDGKEGLKDWFLRGVEKFTEVTGMTPTILNEAQQGVIDHLIDDVGFTPQQLANMSPEQTQALIGATLWSKRTNRLVPMSGNGDVIPPQQQIANIGLFDPKVQQRLEELVAAGGEVNVNMPAELRLAVTERDQLGRFFDDPGGTLTSDRGSFYLGMSTEDLGLDGILNAEGTTLTDQLTYPVLEQLMDRGSRASAKANYLMDLSSGGANNPKMDNLMAQTSADFVPGGGDVFRLNVENNGVIQQVSIVLPNQDVMSDFYQGNTGAIDAVSATVQQQINAALSNPHVNPVTITPDMVERAYGLRPGDPSHALNPADMQISLRHSNDRSAILSDPGSLTNLSGDPMEATPVVYTLFQNDNGQVTHIGQRLNHSVQDGAIAHAQSVGSLYSGSEEWMSDIQQRRTNLRETYQPNASNSLDLSSTTLGQHAQLNDAAFMAATIASPEQEFKIPLDGYIRNHLNSQLRGEDGINQRILNRYQQGSQQTLSEFDRPPLTEDVLLTASATIIADGNHMSWLERTSTGEINPATMPIPESVGDQYRALLHDNVDMNAYEPSAERGKAMLESIGLFNRDQVMASNGASMSANMSFGAGNHEEFLTNIAYFADHNKTEIVNSPNPMSHVMGSRLPSGNDPGTHFITAHDPFYGDQTQIGIIKSGGDKIISFRTGDSEFQVTPQQLNAINQAILDDIALALDELEATTSNTDMNRSLLQGMFARIR